MFLLGNGFSSAGRITLPDAQIGGDLDCIGATLKGTGVCLLADRANITGGVHLGNGFRSRGEISLLGAQIGGNLDCTGATLEATEFALSADGAKVGGAVLLTHGFASAGTIHLLGIQIGGNLECDGAILSETSEGLFADGAKIIGSVTLRYGFSCLGAIRLMGAQIGGTLDCIGAEVREFVCERAHINGNLMWLGVRQPNHANLRLAGTTVATLHDERASWPRYGNLHLLDFVYQDLVLHEQLDREKVANPQISSGLFSDSRLPPEIKLSEQDRIDWLRRQPEDEIANAQPWLQLAKLLETYGDTDGAKFVRYQYQRWQARTESSIRRLASFPYDRLVEEPLWIAPFIATIWLGGSFLFWRAKRMRAMAPTAKDALAEFQDDKPVPTGYPPFNPVIYAFENVLPVVKLGQDSAWAPNHLAPQGTWLPDRPVWLRSFAGKWRLTRWLFSLNYHRLALMRWVLIVVGWASALILAAAIAARFKE